MTDSFTWGNRGVDATASGLLWWESVGAVAAASGAALEQTFTDFLANGPAVDGVPLDIADAVRRAIGSHIVVRPARPDDGPAVAAVRVESWRDAYAHVLSPEFLAALDADADAERWSNTIVRIADDPSRGTFVVAELDGAVRGFAIAGPPRPLEGETPPREWQLFLIYQDAEMHGTGSGQALIEASIGDRPTHLWTAEDNPRAIAFYRRNGFVPDGERTVDADAEDLAEIRMVR